MELEFFKLVSWRDFSRNPTDKPWVLQRDKDLAFYFQFVKLIHFTDMANILLNEGWYRQLVQRWLLFLSVEDPIIQSSYSYFSGVSVTESMTDLK